jgi:hypothetical protein
LDWRPSLCSFPFNSSRVSRSNDRILSAGGRRRSSPIRGSG